MWFYFTVKSSPTYSLCTLADLTRTRYESYHQPSSWFNQATSNYAMPSSLAFRLFNILMVKFRLVRYARKHLMRILSFSIFFNLYRYCTYVRRFLEEVYYPYFCLTYVRTYIRISPLEIVVILSTNVIFVSHLTLILYFSFLNTFWIKSFLVQLRGYGII